MPSFRMVLLAYEPQHNKSVTGKPSTEFNVPKACGYENNEPNVQKQSAESSQSCTTIIILLICLVVFVLFAVVVIAIMIRKGWIVIFPASKDGPCVKYEAESNGKGKSRDKEAAHPLQSNNGCTGTCTCN